MTTKEEIEETLKTATRQRKETQAFLKNGKDIEPRHVTILKDRVRRLRQQIEEARTLLKKMPKHDLQKQKPATEVLQKHEFKKEFRDALGIPQEPAAQIKLDSIEDLEKAWPNIKGKNILVEAPKEVKDELMRRWRKEFNTIKVDGYRPLKMND
jgi:hypothetical protein